MKRIWPALKWCLIVWGAVSLVGVIVVGVSIARRFGVGESVVGSEDTSAAATKEDVRYVLNWCRLGDSRTEEVIHSYVSSRSFNGDHFDAHAIRISHVSVDELKADDSGSGWYRCDQLKGVLADALDFVGVCSSSDDVKWFPTKEQLLTSDYYVYPWSIHCHGTRPSSAELIFVRPSDRMIFYFGCKT
jgi:hypothetical protein